MRKRALVRSQSERGTVQAPRQGARCGHFRADGEEPYGFAPVTGQHEMSPSGDN